MICDIKPGQSIVAFFILRKKELRTMHGNRDFYLSLELGDSSGRIFASVWQNAEKLYSDLEEGQPVKVRAKVIDWKGRAHLSVEKIRPVEERDELDAGTLLPEAKADIQKILADIRAIIEDVKNEQLRVLLNSFYQDEKFAEQFCQAPGGKLWHHCYKGGLAEHTLAVANMCMQIASLYPRIHRDLLVAGALLHDIGKIREYEVQGFFDFSDAGRLLGHIAMGYHKVAERIEALPDFPEKLADQLLHLILSHQGKREQGAPVVPMTREAMILYYADELDSRLNAMERIYNRDKEPGRKWSQYIKLLDRFIYFGDEDDPAD